MSTEEYAAVMNVDDYLEVVNGRKTFEFIAGVLRKERCFVTGWSAENSMHLDIMFTLRPRQGGFLNRGCSGLTDMFVSIIGVGCWGFKIDETYIHPNYVNEKFTIKFDLTTSIKVAELINGVRKLL